MSLTTLPVSDKQLVLDQINRFSDEATIFEISEEISILAALRRADEDIEAGRVIPHEEVVRKSAQWITESSGHVKERVA